MSALGVVDVIEADTFSSDSARPAVPGVGRASAGASRDRTPPQNVTTALANRVAGSIASTLEKAKRQVESFPGPTTYALLADAFEVAGDRDSALKEARGALDIVHRASSAQTDLSAVRTCLQILMRSGAMTEAAALAADLHIGDQLRLEVAAALGSAGSFDDAWQFVRDVSDVPAKDAVAGYLLAMAGDFRRAVPALRAALRREPSDADTALNLSISLWNLGAHRKAMSAALQARAAAPSREDIGLHVFELLLIGGAASRVDAEVRALLDQGVVPSARLLIIQARAKLALRNHDRAMKLLERASSIALDVRDLETYAEVQSNLIRIRASRQKIGREKAIDELLALHDEVPKSAIVVVNLAQVVYLRTHADELARVTEEVLEEATGPQIEFLMFQIADLKGDTEAAASHAVRWLALEPDNPRALAAAMVAVGIGEENWSEAASLAMAHRKNGNLHADEVNNVGYVFAMAGMADRAIELLTPLADESFVLKATLGLAHLAAGQIDEGMRLYRRAADDAEKVGDDTRSLMTAYQALVVRQLGLLQAGMAEKVTAISLPHYPLPEDWNDRPEFLRLLAVARRHGYDWPLVV